MAQDHDELTPAQRHTFVLLLIINIEIVALIIGVVRWFFL